MRAARLLTCDTELPQRAIDVAALGLIEDAAVLCVDRTIAALGPRRDVERGLKSFGDDIQTCDFPQATLVPGFVDAHAHPLFAGDREPDFAARLRGEPMPLGMLHTVVRTREALLDVPTFWESTLHNRLQMILTHGTTTLETKTGYALHEPGEKALLDLIVAHAQDGDIPQMLPTFLGAHALPPEFTNEVDFIDYLIDQCLPSAKAHGARYADAFCEPGFFSPVQTRRYLEAARAYGLRLRVHCDEMAYGGAAAMAVQIDVDAVDHCNFIDEQDVAEIAQRGIVLVACPATIAYLDLPRQAPVQALLARGGRVALASDFNPGTSPCFNLQTVAYFGRKLFGLTAAQSLDAVTRTAAASLHLDAGRLRVGAAANLVALELGSVDEFGWLYGANLAVCVVKNGSIVR